MLFVPLYQMHNAHESVLPQWRTWQAGKALCTLDRCSEPLSTNVKPHIAGRAAMTSAKKHAKKQVLFAGTLGHLLVRARWHLAPHFATHMRCTAYYADIQKILLVSRQCTIMPCEGIIKKDVVPTRSARVVVGRLHVLG
jgi:hypothetical protein